MDLALTLISGGEAISGFQALAHLAPVIGPVPSNPTVWRTLSEIGDLQLARVNAAVTRFRRHWWGLLSARPERFPWLKVAGRELTGITVVDLDASIVFARSDKKENAVATYKGGIGFCPNLAACDNTGDMLAIDPRPGNSTSNCAADNIALLDLAVSRLPGPFRHNMLFRLDGAGFSHELLVHIAANGGRRGRHWELSVGWSCTDAEMDAIARIPEQAWTLGIDQDGEVLEDARVAELTGLPDLGAWTEKIPGLRTLVREEPLHPCYLKRASQREIKLGKRYHRASTPGWTPATAPTSMSPLDYSTYKAQYDGDSIAFLYFVRDRLNDRYATTKTSSRQAAVVLDFKVIRADVVPAFSRKGGGYFIPNGKKGWTATNPEYHARLIRDRDSELDGRLNPPDPAHEVLEHPERRPLEQLSY